MNIDFDARLAILVDDGEGEVLDVVLDFLLVEFAADQSLDVENGPVGVRRKLVLRGC